MKQVIEREEEIISRLSNVFQTVFCNPEEEKKKEDIQYFFAPGRVNLIGEHIDYCGGVVFPCTFSLGTYAAVCKRNDNKIRFYSENFKSNDVLTYKIGDYRYQKNKVYTNYVLAVLFEFEKRGYHLTHGFDIVFYGNIPYEAGLSSSASLEVLMAYIFCCLEQIELDFVEIAKLCKEAENEFVGVNCGIMDQFVIANGKKNCAILLNTNTLSYEYVKLDLKNCSVVISCTNKKRTLADSKYNERKLECDEALLFLQREMKINSLCDISIEQFEQKKYLIQDDVCMRRARHAIYENERTKKAVDALKCDNLSKFGEYMNQSHDSLKEDYCVTGIELDTLVEEAQKQKGVLGSRMTGAGFGGCTVSIVKNEYIDSFIKNVSEAYQKKIGYEADFIVACVDGGPRRIVNINATIMAFLSYAQQKKLVKERDLCYATNKLLDLLKLDAYEPANLPKRYIGNETKLATILDDFLSYAVHENLIEDSIVEKDLFDTKIMDTMMPPPSVITDCFNEIYKKSKNEATEFYYEYSQNTNYIRRDRIAKDMKWKTDTKYGTLDITINLSKPEKDPKDIERAAKLPQNTYPKCMLCKENEGFAGNLRLIARQNHRTIPIKINKENWFFQYSPYVYYNEHCIVFNEKHIPICIDHQVFSKLFDFVDLFPHYFVGSNADLPIVGGSILSHEHFQGGCYQFAMERAKNLFQIHFEGYEDIEAGILNWPLSVIRLSGRKRESIEKLAVKILEQWRDYTDESVYVFSDTDGVPHNTITPIARKCGNAYQLDLVLRNNLTTSEYPCGVFHPQSQYHHIKKENIGLIEVMGLAVLPRRLKQEMELLAQYIAKNQDYHKCEKLKVHYEWADEIIQKHKISDKQDILIIIEILKQEIGFVFEKVLEDCGVFKQTKSGKEAFNRFLKKCNGQIIS